MFQFVQHQQCSYSEHNGPLNGAFLFPSFFTMENDENVYWHVITNEWEDYAMSEEEKDELINYAKQDGLKYSCTRHVEGETY